MSKTTDAAETATHEIHRVGFYETDAFLTDAVVDFMAPGLADHESALIVATAPHCEQFLAGLAASGVDVAEAQDTGRLIVLDARATLQTLLIDGRIDRTRFGEAVGDLLAMLGADGAPIRIYGEMVALLCDDDDLPAALALENLWNEFAELHHFAVLCAYPMRQFCGPDSDAAFQSVCRRHTAVTNESYLWLGNPDQGPAIVTLERRAD